MWVWIGPTGSKQAADAGMMATSLVAGPWLNVAYQEVPAPGTAGWLKGSPVQLPPIPCLHSWLCRLSRDTRPGGGNRPEKTWP
ncbi:MAG: hypothetical protein MZV64_48500 [Ignavibacteriales bacterium]|nr:hypothetical protein [Ignavibacteriales bacterium]